MPSLGPESTAISILLLIGHKCTYPHRIRYLLQNPPHVCWPIIHAPKLKKYFSKIYDLRFLENNKWEAIRVTDVAAAGPDVVECLHYSLLLLFVDAAPEVCACERVLGVVVRDSASYRTRGLV